MSDNFIQTASGRYEFMPEELYYGRKQIDKENTFQILLDLKEVFDARNIKFGLIYGTLLGATREGDFITWDEDADIFMLNEQLTEFCEALWDLRSRGIELVRKVGDLYSLMRNGDYVDVYFFELSGSKRKCNEDTISARHLNFKNVINFKGVDFHIPNDHEFLLSTLYGKDWRTPQRNKPAKAFSFTRRAKVFIQDHVPKVYAVLRRFKKVMRR